MLTSRKIIIQDTCILLDLVELKLLDVFFQLDFHVFTTPHVVSEITIDTQWVEVEFFIEKGDLQINSEGTVESIFAILSENNGLSFADGSVYELGLRTQGIIISSDRSLRKCCKKAGLQVHGMLWVIQELYNRGKIDTESACSSLRLYSQMNPRAPQADISILIDQLIAFSI